MGQIDLVIALSYVIFLGAIGTLMGIESSRSIWRKKHKKTAPVKPLAAKETIIHKLPFKMRFPRSRLYISVTFPFFIGFMAGVMVSLMGIGGGFFMIPAMIYLLGMPTSVVIGTSLFQIIFITANVTILQAMMTQTVDIVLALLLIIGAVTGAQIGTKLGTKLPAEQLRGLLAILVLAVAGRITFGLLSTPDDIFTLEIFQ
jgi:uncharacterized membrane protein YfcA